MGSRPADGRYWRDLAADIERCSKRSEPRRRSMERRSSFSARLRGALVAGSLVVLAVAVRAEEKVSVASGRALFETYCTSCHGAGGRSDGRAGASLGVPVPDLTLLSRRNQGTFPREETVCAIDGRDGHRARGTPKMPIWGLTLQDLEQDRDQEGEVRSRIGDLVLYLESIQNLD
jgi:mono/diheme cytochrome c family protein